MFYKVLKHTNNKISNVTILRHGLDKTFRLNGALIPDPEIEENNMNLITLTTDLAIQSVKAR